MAFIAILINHGCEEANRKEVMIDLHSDVCDITETSRH